MKLFSGIITILFALLISATAAWFSVAGLVALFAATAIPVMIMGTVLETSKLVAAGWLHANWKNRNVNFLHKSYLTLAVLALMLITSIGIYGFLSKGHLEQAAPVAGIELQVNAKQQQIQMLTDANTRLTTELKQLDSSVDALLANNKTTQSLRVRSSQGKERANIQQQMNANNDQIQKLNADILPLKQQTVEVEAKLGPVKYVAQLFGWQDTDKAVRLVILVIMFAFDPLAVILLISATISFAEYAEEKRAKKALPPAAGYDGDYEEFTPEELAKIQAIAAKDLEGPVNLDVDEFPTNEEMRVVSPSQAYSSEYRLARGQLVDPIEPILHSSNVAVTEPGLNAQQDVEQTAQDGEVVHASEETITPVRSDLEEDLHGRIEPTFGTPEVVVDANEPSFQQEEQTQDNEDKLAELRATDPMAPETVAHEEVASETAPEAPQEVPVEVTAPVAEAAPNDKERLIEILEKRPEILQDLIDVISSHRQQEESNIAKAKEAAAPKPWIQ